MNYLETLDFTADEIDEILDTVPKKLLTLLTSQKELVTKNIEYLKDLGVTNYKEVFLKFYDMFLMDYSNFVDIFAKYDPNDLIEKIKKNYKVVEYL